MPKRWRLLGWAGIGTIVAVAVVALGARWLLSPTGPRANFPETVPAAARDCTSCHNQSTPGIVHDYAMSKHAKRNVTCQSCHQADAKNATTEQHYGYSILAAPTPRTCGSCHAREWAQFDTSRHSARAWYAMTGPGAFNDADLAKYGLDLKGKPNSIFTLEGPESTVLGCQVCHNIGRPNADGSYGDCSKCHLRHTFSLAQVRKPEACAQCHIGPDHPQMEIYQESPHGTLYAHEGATWNWDAAPGTLSSKDQTAPTCATCHMSGFAGAAGTHNVGDRLSWYSAPNIATRREGWQSRRTAMTTVCLECHTKPFIDKDFKQADDLIAITNSNVQKGQAIMDGLKKDGFTWAPFEHAIDFVAFELWHHEGRRARFGATMQGPDYVQWHGIYDQTKDLVELRQMEQEIRAAPAPAGAGQGGTARGQ
ncbi:MAG: multiheme c-type cytochrome [Symbiobacteriia bacterium]